MAFAEAPGDLEAQPVDPDGPIADTFGSFGFRGMNGAAGFRRGAKRGRRPVEREALRTR